jgi:hypothetical protein
MATLALARLADVGPAAAGWVVAAGRRQSCYAKPHPAPADGASLATERVPTQGLAHTHAAACAPRRAPAARAVDLASQFVLALADHKKDKYHPR